MAPTFGYWSLRGLAEPIRYMLHHLNVEYEEKFYDIGAEAATARDQWLKDKENLGLEFPNLPYYIDGDLKITESAAILKHIARKHNLAGSCEEDYIRLDVAQGILTDIGTAFAMLCYSPDFASRKEAFVADVPTKMAKLSKLLGEREYILGGKISFMDFSLFELLERYNALVPGCYAKHANLAAFHQRVEALPAIAKYRASPAFLKMKTRFNGRFASFGGGDY